MTVLASPSAKLFFVSDADRRMLTDPDMATVSWMSPTLHVSHEALFAAIDQVEELGNWLEDRMFAAKYPNRASSD